MVFGAAQVSPEVACGNLAHSGECQNGGTALAHCKIRYLSGERTRRWQVAPANATDKSANNLQQELREIVGLFCEGPSVRDRFGGLGRSPSFCQLEHWDEPIHKLEL